MFNSIAPALISSFIDEAIEETSQLNTALEIEFDNPSPISSAKPSQAVLDEVRKANFDAFMAQATIPNISVDIAPLETLRKNIQGTMSLYPDQVNESSAW